MKRSWLLAGFLGLTFSTIFILPKLRLTPSALDTAIPAWIGSWETYRYEPSQRERDTLAKDTIFSKAKCVLGRFEDISLLGGSKTGAEEDSADLSIVLSGEDLTNSIHRPERCMEAQGHKILDSQEVQLTLEDQKGIKARRLISDLTFKPDGSDAEITQHCLTYYFFVGHDRETADHMERNKIDIMDRLKKGEAQRWSYVLVSMRYTEGEEGVLLKKERVDGKMQNLIKELCRTNVNWDMLATATP